MYWNGPNSMMPEVINYGQSDSQQGQDNWVLNTLGGKKNGVYVEIGAGHPISANNTLILEQKFGWSGVSLEINKEMADLFRNTRNNPCINTDAMAFDYWAYFANNNFPKQIDYLQIDIDDRPPNANLLGLIALPLAEYRFSTLTVEHGCVTDYKNSRLRDAQRIILDSFGYRLIVQGQDEDWWVDPKAVPYEKYGFMFSIRNS
mgnify:FL=1|jgi:hypothetical protein